MKKYTHVIWDFNGTLYDDVEPCIKSANRLLTAHGLAPLSSVERYRALFGFPIVDYYRRMGFDFEKTPYSELAIEWVDYYMEESRNARIYGGALEVLDLFRTMKVSQVILSATEKQMLTGQLLALGVYECFDEVLGQDNIHAFGKQEIGLAWREKHPDAVPLFIGDTEHDAEVARAMGADCVLLACGHRPRAALECCDVLAVQDEHTALLHYLRAEFGKSNV